MQLHIGGILFLLIKTKLTMRQFLFIYLILFISLFSCAENNQSDEGISSQDLQKINLTKKQVFGDINDVMFDRIGRVDVDDSNRVYIAERSLGNRTIHVFSQDGDYLTNVSREGNGPGEYRTLGYLEILSDKLYLFDSFHKRISIFTIDSSPDSYSFLGNKSISSSEIKGGNDKKLEKAFVFKDGELLAGFEDPPIPNNPEREIYYYRFDSEGNPKQDKVLFEQNAVTIFKTEANSFSITMQLPFSRRSLIAVSSTGLIFKAWSEDFKIDVLNSSGEHIRSISVPFDNSPLDKSKVLEWYKSHDDFYKAIREAPFPDDWPALNGLLTDDKNRLWVSTIVENLDIYEWWVIESTGEVVSKFTWPRDKPIKEVKNGYLYTKEEDDRGVAHIVSYKIKID